VAQTHEILVPPCAVVQGDTDGGAADSTFGFMAMMMMMSGE
jgi:hypothetical protein